MNRPHAPARPIHVTSGLCYFKAAIAIRRAPKSPRRGTCAERESNFMQSFAIALSPSPLYPFRGILNAVRDLFIAVTDRLMDSSFFSIENNIQAQTPSVNADHPLIQRCKNNDRSAFEEIVHQHQDAIFNLCVRLLGNYAEGQDAAQETFIKAYQAIGGFKEQSQVSTWLFRIATNVCRNRQTSFWGRLRLRAVRLDNPGEYDGGEPVELPSEGKNPEELLGQKRIAQAIRNGLSKLPQKYRELIVLADLNDRSYEEIQVITGMALGTIKSRLARGREALREALTGV